MKGKFLVLEGIDGCGKTTQINHLAKWLPHSGLMPKDSKLHVTHEPGGTALGGSLRELLLKPPNNQAPEPLTELLLYAADRAQHVSQLILPALTKGDWVLSDRFSGSTIAYQGYGRNLDIDLIKSLEKIASQGLIPNVTIWLDLPINESLTRRGERSNDRIEAEGAEFLKKVALGFSHLAKERDWKKVSALQEQTSVSKHIESIFKNYLNDSKQ